MVPSHFQYARQALLYLPPEMPDPAEPNFQKRRRSGYEDAGD